MKVENLGFPQSPSAAGSRRRNLYPDMSVFHPLELMDSYSHYPYREANFPESRLSSFHFPLAHAVQSEDEYLAFDFDVLYPSSTPLDHPCPFFLHRHYYNHHHRHHHYHPLPLSRLLPHFLVAATDHCWPNRDARALGDRLTLLELGFDRALCSCIAAPEIKWKWKAEIKGPKGNRFDCKYKCTEESKGTLEKSMKWTAEFQGKGKYAPLSRMYKFHAASAAMQDGYEKAKKDQKVEGKVARPVDVFDETDQKLNSIRQALAKRNAHKSKGKKKELSSQDAAISIQRTFKDYMTRRSRTLHCLRDLAVAKSKLKEIRSLFSRFSYRHRLENDAEQRQRFSEKIIILLLTIDAIEGPDCMVRSAKRSMTRELEAVLEVVDPQLMRRRKFDLPAGSLSMEMASGVADVIHMLDQDDNASSALPVFLH